jgi:DNA-binding transcriptional LysR family regulator
MESIEIVNISSKKLNLLPIFQVIGEELNLSRAAERLGTSQPALSHSLGRLRDLFQDPLFVRVPHGLAPTPRAAELLPEVHRLVQGAEGLFRTGALDLKTLERRLVIAATTYFELRVLDKLVSRLRREAPRVTLATVSLQGEFPKAELERGDVDVAIAAYFAELPGQVRMKKLSSDPHVCVTRKNHAFIRSRGGKRLDDYLKYGHVMISVPLGAKQQIDVALEAMGKRRDVVAHLNNFISAPQVVASSDLILTCPKTLAERYASWFDLAISATPIETTSVQVKMVWHERNQADPFHRWVRGIIEDALG